MDSKTLESYIDLFTGSDLGEMEIGHGRWTLRLARGPARASADASTTVVRAASGGTVLFAHPSDGKPLVRAGQQVAAGQALALLQDGPILRLATAPRAGRVRRILPRDEAPVDAGDALVEID